MGLVSHHQIADATTRPEPLKAAVAEALDNIDRKLPGRIQFVMFFFVKQLSFL